MSTPIPPEQQHDSRDARGYHSVDRRTILKTSGGILVVVSLPASIGTVAAATDYEATLALDGTLPSNTAIEVTVIEYEDDTDSSKVDSATISATDLTTDYDVDIPASSQYYDFEIEFGSNEDDSIPDVSTLSFTIAEVDSDSSGVTSTIIEWATGGGDDGDGWFSFSWWPFGRSSKESSDEDDTNTTDSESDGGWFDFNFDFWPFNGDESESDS